MTDTAGNATHVPASIPANVQEGLHAYAEALQSILQQNLLAICLYGSVASGCSNGTTSDVDTITILKRPIDDETRQAFLAAHQANPLPLDATYITQEEMNRDIFPTPLQCVIRPVKLFRVPNGLVDFPIVRNDVYTSDRTIIGPPVRNIVRPVPWPLLSDCLRRMFPVALERFKNPILMLCRIVCSLRTRRACSKARAAAWALEHFDPKWHDLLQQALDDYRTGRAARDLPTDLATAFERYCRQQV